MVVLVLIVRAYKSIDRTKIDCSVDYGFCWRVNVMAEYEILVNEQQLKTISLALDIFSRLEGGQLKRCFSMINWKNYDNLTSIQPMLEQIQLLLTGMTDGNLGIGNVSTQSQMAYDLHQVIRHYLAWKETPEGGIEVRFDRPLQFGDEPLAKITSKTNQESLFNR